MNKAKRGRPKTLTSKQRIKNKYDYINAWRKANSKNYTIKFNSVKDKEIIEKLENVGNKTEYLRSLIIKDIKES